MNIAVRYFSRGGNTKKIAEAIGEAVGVEAKELSETFDGTVDLLFLGGSVYGFDIDEEIKQYIKKLDIEKVRYVAVFGTSAIIKTGNDKIINQLCEKNIPVDEKGFYCRGAFTVMHKGRPNEYDMEQAKAFAVDVLNSVKGK